MRKLVDIEPSYARVSEDQIKAIAEELFEGARNDPSLYLDALKSFGDFELLDILADELRDHPDSAMSKEIRRRVKQKCRTEAKIIASIIMRL